MTQSLACHAIDGLVVCDRFFSPAVASYNASNGLVVPPDELDLGLKIGCSALFGVGAFLSRFSTVSYPYGC